MTQLCRLRVAWGGSQITGGGLSTFYFATSGSGTAASVKAFFTAIAGRVPAGVTWTVPTSGDLIEDTTGALAGAWSEPSGGGVVTSTGAVNYAAGVGCRVSWQTTGIHNGRRVKGSTFIVPLVSAVYATDGTIDSVVLSEIQTAATNLVTAQPAMKVLSKAKVGSPGASSTILSATAVDKVSWLRSRRT